MGDSTQLPMERLPSPRLLHSRLQHWPPLLPQTSFQLEIHQAKVWVLPICSLLSLLPLCPFPRSTCGAGRAAGLMGRQLPPVHVRRTHILTLSKQLQPIPKEQEAQMKRTASCVTFNINREGRKRRQLWAIWVWRVFAVLLTKNSNLGDEGVFLNSKFGIVWL